jgi:thymidylate kinase
LKIQNNEYGFLYIFLFYLLNGSSVNKKYQEYYMSLLKFDQEQILDFINSRYELKIDKLETLFTFDETVYLQILKNINQENNQFIKIKNLLSYLQDFLINSKKSKIITFSGVDGAGKTTILREFKELLEKKYRRNVVELRHRPSVLPILSAIKHGKKEAEKKTMEVLPRTGNNKSKLSSYIRFFYYLIDYILGQWIILFKHGLRGEIIIYDRYYFDFINDAKRTNIRLNENFIKFFYKFVFKPDMNIFLYAPPEVILSRKQEMDKESIVTLTKKYKTLFEELAQKKENQYISIENIDKEATMKTIEDIYVRTSL